ncbi:MAG: hypothetical protein HY905_24030 [Deltaproteobacteria bacterium]|nr:hypothetical protein [Deltaproteobacteria bacterium]
MRTAPCFAGLVLLVAACSGRVPSTPMPPADRPEAGAEQESLDRAGFPSDADREALEPSERPLLDTFVQTPADPQDTDSDVGRLLDQARQAYERTLDIESATACVDEAITLVRRSGLAGSTAALAYAMRGVIHVWRNEEVQAVEMFKSALAIDPYISIPASWDGPEVYRAFERARPEPPPLPSCPRGTLPLRDGTCAVVP